MSNFRENGYFNDWSELNLSFRNMYQLDSDAPLTNRLRRLIPILIYGSKYQPAEVRTTADERKQMQLAMEDQLRFGDPESLEYAFAHTKLGRVAIKSGQATPDRIQNVTELAKTEDELLDDGLMKVPVNDISQAYEHPYELPRPYVEVGLARPTQQ